MDVPPEIRRNILECIPYHDVSSMRNKLGVTCNDDITRELVEMGVDPYILLAWAREYNRRKREADSTLGAKFVCLFGKSLLDYEYWHHGLQPAQLDLTAYINTSHIPTIVDAIRDLLEEGQVPADRISVRAFDEDGNEEPIPETPTMADVTFRVDDIDRIKGEKIVKEMNMVQDFPSVEALLSLPPE